ncbi:hypothetical protein V6N13_023644 [Hibiscus sabdariffa]
MPKEKGLPGGLALVYILLNKWDPPEIKQRPYFGYLYRLQSVKVKVVGLAASKAFQSSCNMIIRCKQNLHDML